MSNINYIFWIFALALLIVVAGVIVCNAETNVTTNIWIKGVEYTPKPYLTQQDKSNIVVLCDKFIKEIKEEQIKCKKEDR